MLEETYHSVRNFYENWEWKKDCYIIQCRYCGNIWISTSIERCICCSSGNIFPIPFRNHSLFSFDWLRGHGFPFVEELTKWNL